MNNFNSFEQMDLQLALIFIGVIIIVAIIIYNIARSNKSRRQQRSINEKQSTFESNLASEISSDLGTLNKELAESHRKEPSLTTLQITDSESRSVDSSNNFDLNTQSEDTENVSLNTGKTTYISRIDPTIDCVVDFKFSLPVQGVEILELVQKWPKKEDYRIAIEGLTESAPHSGQVNSYWELLQGDNFYRELQVSIQLANRRGPLQAESLAEFIGLVQGLSQELDAEIDVPPIHDILNDATDLDQFAIQCDIQLGFNLTCNLLSWQCAEVQNALLNNGFILSREGSSYNYMMADMLIFKAQVPSLNFLRDDLQTTSIRQVYFSLDVPLVPEELNPFIKMLEVAHQIARDLDGRLLDDNGQSLSLLSTQSIQAQIEPIYRLMRERNIEPGSASALRLFN